jgi:hypothetical protein
MNSLGLPVPVQLENASNNVEISDEICYMISVDIWETAELASYYCRIFLFYTYVNIISR